MQLVIVTDIFGISADIKSLQKALKEIGVVSTVADPFWGEIQHFETESEAYESFIKFCGHEEYVKRVQGAIEKHKGSIVIIGFSAGASAVWKVLTSSLCERIQYFFGFYPSQIRNNLSDIPSTEMTLIFPFKEEHFDIDSILDVISKEKNINSIRSKYLHGFMNPSSENYSSSAATTYIQKILSYLTSTRDNGSR